MKQLSASIAKISRPSAAHLLPRERLFRLLDRDTEKSVCWISAPAGSGKTSLVTSWLEGREHTCIWYQIDRSDQDPASFFYYLRQAEASLNHRKQKLLPLCTADYLPDVASFTRRYFEELFARLTVKRPAGAEKGRPAFLVLDNYQEIPAESPFHDILRQALEVIPREVTVIVVSRTVAPPQFARLRANNRMALLGWSELRLSAEESSRILALHGLPAHPALLRELQAKADGWAAGLVLLTGMAKADGPAAHLSAERTPEEVFDYFANEVFKTFDDDTRKLLLKTAFAPCLSLAMAERLTGCQSAGRVLAELSRNNYFTDWRAADTPVYQYHPLFRDFLRLQARRLWSAEELAERLRATARVLGEAGYPIEAAELFAEAGDHRGLAELVLAHAGALVEQGRSKTLWPWFEKLPPEAYAADPWLSFWRGAALHPYDMPGSLACYDAAFHGLVERGSKGGALLAWAGVGINIITEWREFSRLDRQIALLTPELEGQIGILPPDLQARLLGAILLSFGFRQPGHGNVKLYEKRACELVLGNALSLESLLLLGSYLLIHYTKMGELVRAKVLLEVIEPRTRQKDLEVCPGLVLWRMLAASCYGLAARKQRCLDGLAEALELSAATGIQIYDIFSLFYGALCGFIDADLRTVDAFLERIAAVQGAKGLIYPIVYRQILGWKQLVAGDYRSALEHVEAALELTRSHEAPIEVGINLIARAQLLFELGRREEAGLCLREVEEGNATHSAYIRYMLSCTLAWVAFQDGDPGEGETALARAMAIGAERRVLMHHFWSPRIMGYLCCQALARGIEPEYVHELVARHQLIPDAELPPGVNWPWPLKIYTLGHFQLETRGERLAFSGKKQAKPLSLLKALVVHGEQGVPADSLCDLIWPDAEGDAAHSSLKMTLSRLRRLLGDARLVELKEGRLALNGNMCWVDAWAFRDLYARVEARPAGEGETLAPLVDQAIAIYHGEFLYGEKSEYWEIDYRERLQRKFRRLLRTREALEDARAGAGAA